MCVAVPGKVIEIKDGTAIVDFSGNRIEAMTGLVDVALNDYVLVHAGCVIQVMKEDEAVDLIDLMREVNGEH